MRRLIVSSLTIEGFAPYGEVLDASRAPTSLANNGTIEVHRDVAVVDVAARRGRVCLSVVRAKGRALPFRIEAMECHPLGSQAIAPLGTAFLLIVVAPAGPLDLERIVAFRALGHQGVNYRRGVWHQPLVSVGHDGDFLVVDRAGDGENLIFQRLLQPIEVAGTD
jgi:ureidoglycolate lyase